MNEIQIGERQTVQRAKHPTMGEGRLVYDNGPAFFVADSGEVEHYRKAFCDQAWKKDGGEVKFDTKGYPNGKSHQRIVRLSDGKPGWLSSWFDDFHTWCHVFEPDDGSAPFKFPVTQAWVGGEKDGGDPPKSREHLMTCKGREGVFVYYREEDRAQAEAAAKMPATGKRGTKKAPVGPMPGPETPLAPTQCPCRGWAGPGWPHVRGAAGCQYAIADETPLGPPPFVHLCEIGDPSPRSEPEPRKGDWMQTFSGRQFWPIDPRAEEVDILDIAHALSHLCRFAGHVRRFYSVADHSIRVSRCAPFGDRMLALGALLHDATEAYVVDVPRPLKRFLPGYKEIEERVARAIERRFDLETGILDHPSVKHWDEALLATEARDLMGGECAGKWHLRAAPLPGIIVPRTSEEARVAFLERFDALGGKR